jgi:Protein of unknown function (DUF2730)
MDYGNAAQLGSFLISLLTFFFVVATYRSKAASDRVLKIETSVNVLEGTVTKLAVKVDNLPDQEAIHRMELLMEKMQSSIAVMAAEFKPIAATNSRLQDYLLRQSEPEKPMGRRPR